MHSFIRQNARWLGGGFLLTFFSSFGQTFFIGLSGAELRQKFSLSDGEFGALYMMATILSAVTLVFLGRSLDHWRGVQITPLIFPAFAGACLLLAFAPDLLTLFMAIYLLRLLGQGMLSHIAYTEISRWFSANRGRATALIVPGHQAGEALLPILFTSLSLGFGWQAGWVLAAGGLVLLAWPITQILWRSERQRSSDEAAPARMRNGPDMTAGQVVRDPVFYALLCGVLAPPFIGTSLFFHQDYLIAYRGYSSLAFASAFPLMAVTTVLFSLISGQLIDRFGAIRLLPFFLIPLSTACLVAGTLTPLWGIYIFMSLIGLSYGFTATLIGALWPEIYGTAHLGSVRAIAVAAMVASTAIGPGLTGYLIDQGVSLPGQMIIMSAWCLMACGVLAMITPYLVKRSAAKPE